jgi:nucleoside-diphosphate-sugar epimerase
MGGVGTSRSSIGKGQFIYKEGPFSAEILEALKKTHHVLISIPPGEEGDPLIPFIQEALNAFTHLQWIGYLSSTSIYGDHLGAWVNENSETNPHSPQGIARLKAEDQWLSLNQESGLPVHIFRLSGIYGPGRNVLEDLKAGRAQRIVKENVVFSRIHIADIVQALKSSVSQPNPGRIYNLADNFPAPSHEVVAYGAHLLGIPPPPLVPLEKSSLSALGHSFYQDSKRVRNDRLLKELVPSLLFPTYKEGLDDLFFNL